MDSYLYVIMQLLGHTHELERPCSPNSNALNPVQDREGVGGTLCPSSQVFALLFQNG